MQQEPNEAFAYDDAEAVAFIGKQIESQFGKRLDPDQIYYFVDLIYDYYTSRGILDEFSDDMDDDTVIDLDLNDITDYVESNLKRDDMGSFSRAEIEAIIEAEMDYCASLGLVEEAEANGKE